MLCLQKNFRAQVMKRVYTSLECVGNTPLVRLNRVTEGLYCVRKD